MNNDVTISNNATTVMSGDVATVTSDATDVATVIDDLRSYISYHPDAAQKIFANHHAIKSPIPLEFFDTGVVEDEAFLHTIWLHMLSCAQPLKIQVGTTMIESTMNMENMQIIHEGDTTQISSGILHTLANGMVYGSSISFMIDEMPDPIRSNLNNWLSFYHATMRDKLKLPIRLDRPHLDHFPDGRPGDNFGAASQVTAITSGDVVKDKVTSRGVINKNRVTSESVVSKDKVISGDKVASGDAIKGGESIAEDKVRSKQE